MAAGKVRHAAQATLNFLQLSCHLAFVERAIKKTSGDGRPGMMIGAKSAIIPNSFILWAGVPDVEW